MKSVNPANGQVIRDYPAHNADEVARLLRHAVDAFLRWKDTSFADRAGLMRQAGELLRVRRPELSMLMTTEMGKPITAAEAEIDKCAVACDYFADHAEQYLAPQQVPSDAARSLVRFDPLGPVLAVMPWNFPFWQVFRFAAPNLMAGNVGLLKHAANVPGCAMAIEAVFRDAGFPPGVFTTLLIGSDAVDTVIRDPAVAAVTLTGSEKAGRAVAAAAGQVLKKCVLELGGSDPFIVLPDVDIDRVAAAAATARCINNGQSCIAAKRFIVHNSIAEKFEVAFTAAIARLTIGDPMDRDTAIGPLARLNLLEDLHDQVQRTLAAGATLLTGGQRLPRPGYYYQPTVLANVRPGMPAFEEETFGPVAAITRAEDVDDAIRLANLSRFGLGSSIWTADIDLALRLARRLDAGLVFINETVKSDPRLPFGGVKNSGFGRELSEAGIREFMNTKTVWIQPGH